MAAFQSKVTYCSLWTCRLIESTHGLWNKFARFAARMFSRTLLDFCLRPPRVLRSPLTSCLGHSAVLVLLGSTFGYAKCTGTTIVARLWHDDTKDVYVWVLLEAFCITIARSVGAVDSYICESLSNFSLNKCTLHCLCLRLKVTLGLARTFNVLSCMLIMRPDFVRFSLTARWVGLSCNLRFPSFNVILMVLTWCQKRIGASFASANFVSGTWKRGSMLPGVPREATHMRLFLRYGLQTFLFQSRARRLIAQI